MVVVMMMMMVVMMVVVVVMMVTAVKMVMMMVVVVVTVMKIVNGGDDNGDDDEDDDGGGGGDDGDDDDEDGNGGNGSGDGNDGGDGGGNDGVTEDYLSYHSTLKPYAEEEPDSPLLYRTMSEAALVRRRTKAPMAYRKDRQSHRASINGHVYNHETSIFTPTFGSETKVRTNSTMRTEEVIKQLLQKFKIENSPRDFALYIIFGTGEQRKLKKSDVPLLQRLLQGPSKSNARIFLMDKDTEEISSDVAQYINFHFSFLESILQRLDEEEKREIERIMAKFSSERAFILKCLQNKQAAKTETTV
ncbi:hypothetical protein U0070_018437 [Myodes glareolus]|uniref:Ras association domain-containing protein 6 n=1 Tax=Myodes glareolus TaxID=447135 RepID=A0AAW0JVU7_MYOGA